jgi:ribonuclease D
MKLIKDNESLKTACQSFSGAQFITVDTEFLRETTYWPKLCLIQIASETEMALIDTLTDNLDLKPFFDLMANADVLKVFHACRQDVEIIYAQGGIIPAPLFDTQIAAMVCGFGDSISYDQLVHRITRASIDKSHRFTDWSRRPLSQAQLEYALADVTHLRDVYHHLQNRLQETGRTHWLAEEMAVLKDPHTYDMPAENAWKRLKMRAKKPIELAVTQQLAAWRETEARKRNVPRGRVIKDDAIYEIAAQRPQNTSALAALRTSNRGFENSKTAEDVLAIVKDVSAWDRSDLPRLPKPRRAPEGASSIVELLRVLLKMTSEEFGVAARLIATSDDLDKIAADDNADVGALQGWRRELFGERALKLKHGKIGLSISDGKTSVISI